MKYTFKYYSDAGHGWIAVKFTLIESLGLLKEITSFSYKKGGTVYLEEDVDAPTVLDRIRKQGDDWSVAHVDHGNRSPIRSYPRYSVA